MRACGEEWTSSPGGQAHPQVGHVARSGHRDLAARLACSYHLLKENLQMNEQVNEPENT